MRQMIRSLANLIQMGSGWMGKASFIGSVILAVVTAMTLTACGPSGNKPNIEWIQDMMRGPGDKPQAYDDFFTDNPTAARVPPDHTVPVGFTPYRYGYDFDKANKENKNPLAGQNSKEVLEVGQKFYETNCMICHGMGGMGDGTVASKMAKAPPSLMSAKIRGWNDGGIYHVISVGQGNMGPYASHIPQAYRWQVVNYIRFMQQNSAVSPSKESM